MKFVAKSENQVEKFSFIERGPKPGPTRPDFSLYVTLYITVLIVFFFSHLPNL